MLRTSGILSGSCPKAFILLIVSLKRGSLSGRSPFLLNPWDSRFINQTFKLVQNRWKMERRCNTEFQLIGWTFSVPFIMKSQTTVPLNMAISVLFTILFDLHGNFWSQKSLRENIIPGLHCISWITFLFILLSELYVYLQHNTARRILLCAITINRSAVPENCEFGFLIF